MSLAWTINRMLDRMVGHQLVRSSTIARMQSNVGGLSPAPFQHQPERTLLGDQIALLRGTAATIIDVGAHQGQSTLEYLMAFPTARVYSFEAEDDNFSALEQATKSYRARSVISRNAIAESNGTATFHINSHHGTHSLLAIGRQDLWAGPAHEVAKRMVETLSLDSFCEAASISAVDILKMDIQGAELAALRGASGLLSKGKIQVIALEVEFFPLYAGQPLFWEIGAYLHQYGYAFYGLYDEVRPTKQKNLVCWADAIFISPVLAT